MEGKRDSGGPEKSGARPTRQARVTIEGFWARVDKSGPIPEHRPELGPCWLWTRATDKRGYGRSWVPGIRLQTGAHRVAWYLTYGSFPDLPELDHLCRVPPCCNPTHLEPVTGAENNRRSTSPSALNLLKTHCKHGHPFDAANTRISPNGERNCKTCVNGRKRAARLQGNVGRIYLERGEPVTVLIDPGPRDGDRALTATIFVGPDIPARGPANVLIERADGTRVVRAFSGLCKSPRATR